MVAELTVERAKVFAGMLVTAGHPYAESAILATALDLMKWCHGAVVGGRVWTPEQQAQAIVDEVRTEWDGWPEKGGTRQLLQLFRAKYARVELETVPISLSDALARKLLAPPCAFCEPGSSHCEFGGPRGHEMEKASIDARAKNPSTQKLDPEVKLTYGQMQQRAAAVYEEEQRRERAQLARLEDRGEA